MATAPYQTSSEVQKKSFVERWFFTGMAVVMIAMVLAAFTPSIVHPAGRRGPLSVLVAAHGIVFFAWLLIFLVQSRLIATRHVGWHKRLGLASILIFALMIPLAYTTTITMVRRGFDLSGDVGVGTRNNPAHEAVFPLFNTMVFSALVVAALAYRRKPEIHKRLMLFANIELMPAPMTHFIGHNSWLVSLPPAVITIPILMFVIAAIGRDWLVAGRIHPLTWGLAILRIVSGFLEAGLIGPSLAWHQFVGWLAG